MARAGRGTKPAAGGARGVAGEFCNAGAGGKAAVPYWWLNAYVADLAHRLSRIYAPNLEQLRKADKDCHEEEDNSFAKGLQKRALHHIHEAIRFTEQGISNAKH